MFSYTFKKRLSSLPQIKNKVSVTTKVAEFKIDPKGFLRITLLDNNEVFDEEEARVQLETAKKITNSEKSLVLVDVRKSMHVPTVEAKKIIASSYPYKIAEAIIINSLGQRLLGNFYFKIISKKNKSLPRKIFTDENSAINWLLEFKP